MADIGLTPPGIRHDRVKGGNATVTGIKFGHVVVYDNAAVNFRDVKLNAGAGEAKVAGICVSQTDPTNGSAVNDSLEICDLGVCEVLADPTQTLVKGDIMITGASGGTVKKLGAEAKPYTIVGRMNHGFTVGATATRVAVTIGLVDLV